MIKKGARAKEYENALLWLEDAGIATRVSRVETPKLPLSSYRGTDSFKLYLLDVGPFGALAGLDPKTILEENKLFIEAKGALAEQFVFEELMAQGLKPYYYHKDKPSREVDFLLDLGTEALPIEVKSGKNVASASLKAYIDDTRPKRAIKLSLRAYVPREDRIVDLIPLYFAGAVEKLT